MINNSLTKYLLAGGAILIIIIIGLVYFLKTPKPYKVFVPENSPAGTTVSLYKGTPPGFPSEIILENKPLDYSGTMTVSGGKTQTTVSYVSDQKVRDLVNLYNASFAKMGWTTTVKSSAAIGTTFEATKANQKITITIVFRRTPGTLVTFQYEK